MNLSKRTTAPSKTNKYYISNEYGGYNPCIEIEGKLCLPNCVGYAYGRIMEVLEKDPHLSTSDAENWYYHTEDGYARSKTPSVFSVVCWKKGEAYNGNDGYGHIAVVESVEADGTIVTSNSAWGGAYFYLKKIKPPYTLSGYDFQGFIHILNEPIKAKYSVGDYRVTCSVLNVRKGAGTNYKALSYDELTKNAKEQAYNLVGYEVNGYPRGVECTVFEVQGNWGRTPSGWICLDYCEKI